MPPNVALGRRLAAVPIQVGVGTTLDGRGVVGSGFTQFPPGCEMHAVQPTYRPIDWHASPKLAFQVTTWVQVSLFAVPMLAQVSPVLIVYALHFAAFGMQRLPEVGNVTQNAWRLFDMSNSAVLRPFAEETD
jgi:hypothetical protein